MKHALVTGSAGFIGRHMTKRLMEEGWKITRIDVKYGPDNDCRDLFRTSDYQYDLVVHCAAVVGGREMIDGQPLAVATDLAIDSDFFQFVARTRPRRSVYYSSSAAYPIAYQRREKEGMTLSEDDINLDLVHNPDAVYGWVKLTGEQVIRYGDLPIHVFRPFSGYGQDQDLTYPFPSFIDRVKRRVEKFEVWGDGTQVRDWIHVDDVVELTLRALEHTPSVWNLCTGLGTSMLDVIELALELGNHEAEIVTRPEQPVGVHYRVGSPYKMFNTLGEPTVALADGIRRALADR